MSKERDERTEDKTNQETQTQYPVLSTAGFCEAFKEISNNPKAFDSNKNTTSSEVERQMQKEEDRHKNEMNEKREESSGKRSKQISEIQNPFFSIADFCRGLKEYISDPEAAFDKSKYTTLGEIKRQMLKKEN